MSLRYSDWKAVTDFISISGLNEALNRGKRWLLIFLHTVVISTVNSALKASERSG